MAGNKVDPELELAEPPAVWFAENVGPFAYAGTLTLEGYGIGVAAQTPVGILVVMVTPAARGDISMETSTTSSCVELVWGRADTAQAAARAVKRRWVYMVYMKNADC